MSSEGSALEGTPAETPSPHPAMFLLLSCIAKERNLGSLLRSAVAFGVAEVVLCGANAGRYGTWGAKGAEAFAAVRLFPSLAQGVAYVRGRGAAVVGIEITPTARSVATHPWSGPVAFLPGNEALGLSASQKALCDSFVYVPQHGNGTASLNVASCVAICLHHFATWAQFPELPREEGKDKYRVVQRWTGEHSPAQLAVRDARAAARAAEGAGGGAVAGGGSVGGSAGGAGGGSAGNDSSGAEGGTCNGCADDGSSGPGAAGVVVVNPES